MKSQLTLALTLFVSALCAAPLFGQDRLAMQEHLIAQEGWRNHVYVDSLGHKTIGVGHHLPDNDPLGESFGLHDSEVDIIFNQDLDRAIQDAKDLGGDFYQHPTKIREVIIYLCFNLGYEGFRHFEKMRMALYHHDYHLAAHELRNSLYAKQLPKRAALYAAMLDAAQ